MPLEINSKKVHADIGRRFGAAVVDMLVLIPIFVVFTFIQSISIPMAMTGVFLSSVLFGAYPIYFHYKFGATLGKLAFGIKVTLPDGGGIGLKQAFLRSSVDLVFSFFMVAAQIIAISNANPDTYLNAGWMERAFYIMSLFPIWFVLVSAGSQFWWWSEFAVLLFNKRRRALHDFMAGTVVIHTEYA